MYNENYPEESELEAIKNWDIIDVMALLSFIEERWWMSDWGFSQAWGKDHIHNKYPVIYLELHTGGWSGNESIIDALLENKLFRSLWYVKWMRGGHYWFEVDPAHIGYKTANELAKERGISRQAIHKSKEYDKIQVSPRIILLRTKTVRAEKT